MDRINRLIIFGLLMTLAMGEANAMNQQRQAQVPQANNSQQFHKMTAYFLGGSACFALAKLNGDQWGPALKKGLYVGVLFSMFNSKASVYSAIGSSAVAGGITRFLGYSNGSKAVLYGAMYGLLAPLIFGWGRDALIGLQKNRIRQNDPDFVRIRGEHYQHSLDGTAYHDNAHRQGSILGKPWWIEIEAQVLQTDSATKKNVGSFLVEKDNEGKITDCQGYQSVRDPNNQVQQQAKGPVIEEVAAGSDEKGSVVAPTKVEEPE